MKKKLNIVMLLAALCIITASTPAYASMNLEADAAVSGISVALNNYFARNEKPEKGLAESVKMVATETIAIGNEKSEKTAVKRLVEDVTPVQEEIVLEEEGGVTWGTVKDTASLRLRDKPNSSAKTLTLLALGEHYIVTGQEGQFLKIQVDDDLEGYVFKDYIDTTISYDRELTEEEKAALQADADKRKAEAEEAMRKLEEAKKAEAEKNKKKEKETKKETQKETQKETKKETKAETKEETKAETKKETKEETTAAKVETKPETKVPETQKAESETVEALNWEDEETEEEGEAEEEFEDEEEEEDEEEYEEIEPKSTVASDNSGPTGVTSATRTAMVAYAKQFLGNPYVYGGTSLTNGCDCSGFTMQIYKHFDISIARNSSAQAAGGTEISAGSAQPGDLFFYESGGAINHVAMYIGNNQVIHASTSTTGIIISNAYYRTPCKVCTYIR